MSKFRTGDDPARWRGHLEFLLANPSKAAQIINRPALPWMNAPAFLAELRKREGLSERAAQENCDPGHCRDYHQRAKIIEAGQQDRLLKNHLTQLGGVELSAALRDQLVAQGSECGVPIIEVLR